MKTNNFNRIAKFYDLLSSLVFGSAIKRSQVHFINKIPTEASVLIVGDGTGWFLYNLLKENHRGSIVSIEASSEMTRLARKRIARFPRIQNVKTIESTLENINLIERFDVVVTNYFLDLFKEDKLPGVIDQLYSLLENKGIWIFTDFKINEKGIHKYWQKFLVGIMYFFFTITTNISNRKLVRFEKYFKNAGLTKIHSEVFFNGMIVSAVYKREY